MTVGSFGVSAGILTILGSHFIPEAQEPIALLLGTAFALSGALVCALFGRKAA